MAKWYSAGISNPSRDEGMGSNPGAVQKKITGRHLGVMTWVWPGPLRVSEVQGRNTCYLLSSSPMSFYLLHMACPVTSGNRPEDVRERQERLLERQVTLGKTRIEASWASNPYKT